MAIPLVVAVGATAISAWSSYQAGQAGSSAFTDQAEAKRRQADSVMDRFDLNSEFTRLEGKVFKGKQTGALAASGIDVGSGFALAALEDTAVKIQRKIEIDRMEAEANRDSLLMGADLDIGRAKAASDAGTLGAVGAVAQGFMMGSK